MVPGEAHSAAGASEDRRNRGLVYKRDLTGRAGIYWRVAVTGRGRSLSSIERAGAWKQETLA